jgi:multimeric flavodoxin WrbA
MRIIAILASPHGLKGNTARLLKIVLDGAKSKGAKTEIIVVNWNRVAPCLGCNVCHIKGKCRQRDAFESIKEKIMEADALILATPNYIDQVSAQLKAFIDRCCGVVHCLGFEGRYGAAVITSGGGGDEPIAEYLERFLIKIGVRPVGSVCATMREIEGKEFPEDIVGKALALGENIVDSVTMKSKTRKVEREMNAFRERMKALIAYRKEEWPFEWKYWEGKRDLISRE